MGKQQSTYAKTKATVKLISAFVFATWIVQFLYFLNPKLPASSHLLCLCSSVCVVPVRKPHCWFSHNAAHIVPEMHSVHCIYLYLRFERINLTWSFYWNDNLNFD